MKTILIILGVALGIVLLVWLAHKFPPAPTPSPTVSVSPTPTPTASPSPSPSPSPTPAPNVPHITIMAPPSVSVGEVFTVFVVADSNGQQIDGLDVLLKISPNLRVIEYIANDLLPVHNFNTQLPASNAFNFSQLTNGGQQLTVNGPIASLKLEALVSGSGTIDVDFTLGSTKDSNIARDGVDMLERVNNGKVTIK